MSSTRVGRRITAIGGVAFVGCWLAMVFGSGLDAFDDVGSVASYLTDSSAAVIWSGFVGRYAAIGLALFGAGMAVRLWQQGHDLLGAVAGIGTAASTGALLVGAGAIWTAGVRAMEDASVSEPYAASTIDLGIATAAFVATVGFALLAFAVGLAALRDSSPVTGWLSLVVAVALLTPFIEFYAIFPFLVWVLLGSYTVLAAQPRTVAQPTPAVT